VEGLFREGFFAVRRVRIERQGGKKKEEEKDIEKISQICGGTPFLTQPKAPEEEKKKGVTT